MSAMCLILFCCLHESLSVHKAVVFRPFKGEVLDAQVTRVNKVGIFTQIGPLACFISKHVSVASKHRGVAQKIGHIEGLHIYIYI